jgi:paraquat-inducible protein B
MSQKPHALKTGIFVLLGLAIALGALVLLGSGRLFTRPVPVIVYFETSVNGLSVGAPVKFKGVPIGQVKRIQIAFDEASIRQRIPVLLELDEDRLISASTRVIDLRDHDFMQNQVNRGLRASLQLESVITGRLYVQLDYVPDPPPVEPSRPQEPYFEIPSISTGLSEFVESLERVDVGGIAHDLHALVRGLNQVVEELQISDIRQEFLTTLDNLQALLQSPSLTNTLDSLGLASNEARALLQNLDPQLASVSTNFTRFTSETTHTFAQLRLTLEDLRAVARPDSLLLGQLQESLENLSEAARSVRRFADSLHRTPSALITGRSQRPESSSAP